jgi:hypothetical protein
VVGLAVSDGIVNCTACLCEITCTVAYQIRCAVQTAPRVRYKSRHFTKANKITECTNGGKKTKKSVYHCLYVLELQIKQSEDKYAETAVNNYRERQEKDLNKQDKASLGLSSLSDPVESQQYKFRGVITAFNLWSQMSFCLD